MLKVAVCQPAPEMAPGSAEWKELARRVQAERPDLFLLNELPFGPWIAAGEARDETVLAGSRGDHERGIELLGELGATTVLGTRLTGEVNEAFVWSRGELQGVHTKQYFPDEPGYYEARWYRPGERHFRVAPAGDLQVGFLICTEVMFNEHARRYGRDGAQLIAVPRAVGTASLDRWRVAMKMAAVVSGCYVVSSNRGGTDSKGQTFGGRGWIIDPRGSCVAETSDASPVAFCDVDPGFVARAQREYPCYVPES